MDNTQQLQGFNKTGVLLLKNITDKIEYHLFNNKLPYPICSESYDINAEFETYYKNNEPIHLFIKNNLDNKVILNQIGKLHKKLVYGVTKYYINDIDIEEILFNNTEQLVHIEIKRMDKKNVVANEGEKDKNESKKYKKENKS